MFAQGPRVFILMNAVGNQARTVPGGKGNIGIDPKNWELFFGCVLAAKLAQVTYKRVGLVQVRTVTRTRELYRATGLTAHTWD